MKILIKNGNIVNRDETIKSDVLCENGRIIKIDKIINCKADKIVDADDNYVLPGLIEAHFHGSYGYDFINNPKMAVESIAYNLLKEGVTSFMASLTVVSHDELCRLLNEYNRIKEYNGAHFLGVHSEGPYLSKEYKALMDERYLRDPSIKEFNEMMEASKDCLKIMTIAPEREGMDEFIKYVNDKNITLMIGHSNATSSEALKALDLGCLGFTHLYNAMSQHLHRNPGNVTAAFLSEKAICELIVDGFHVSKDVVIATYKILGSKRIALISDAMLGKGMEDGDYIFSNLKCRKVGNTVRVIETGRIAGSTISMLDSIRNMKKFTNCSINEISEMASYNPSIICRVNDKKGSIEVGKDSDIIILDDKLNLLFTIIDNMVV